MPTALTKYYYTRYIRVGRRESAIKSRLMIRQANLNGYLELYGFCGEMYGAA
jgi:hypothetical protein